MKSLFTILFILISIPFCLFANVIHVPGDQPWIQAGIDVAVNGDTVLVANGHYLDNINFLGKAITVASHFIIDGDSTHIDSTIIDGSMPWTPDSGSVVYFISGEDTNSVLCGFTITGGSGTYPVSLWSGSNRAGGGIFCEGTNEGEFCPFCGTYRTPSETDESSFDDEQTWSN